MATVARHEAPTVHASADWQESVSSSQRVAATVAARTEVTSRTASWSGGRGRQARKFRAFRLPGAGLSGWGAQCWRGFSVNLEVFWGDSTP